MELPPYRFPTMRGLLIHTWERTWQYIKKAGTVILGISILLWAMMTFPGLSQEEKDGFELQRQKTLTSASLTLKDLSAGTLSDTALEAKTELAQINNQETEASLRQSIAGSLGTKLEFITLYAGFDWRTNISLIGGFAAKEVIVSTLGTAYSMSEVDVEEPESLGERLQNDSHWNKVVAVSVLIFIMFYAPCFVTVVCIAKESSWKWAFFSMGFNTIFAFIMAIGVYQAGMFLNLG
jgi:ferrous iron transport protein B